MSRPGSDRIVVAGGAGWGNVGDDLIADTIVRRYVATGYAVIVLGGPHALELPGDFRHIPLDGTVKNRAAALGEIAQAALVVIGGGGLFADRTPGFFRPFVRVARAARVLRTPYIIRAVGVGAIQRSGTAEAYRRAFEGAAFASVRDEASRIRIVATGVRQPPEIEDDPALWPAELPSSAPVEYDLVVNVRNWEHGETSDQKPIKGTDDVVDAVASAVNECLPSARIALVSMSTYVHDDDGVPLARLAARLTGDADCFFGGDLPLIESIVYSAKAVLSMRLHLALLGVRHGKPVAGIAYDTKVEAQGERHGFETVALDESFGPESMIRLLRAVMSESLG